MLNDKQNITKKFNLIINQISKKNINITNNKF